MGIYGTKKEELQKGNTVLVRTIDPGYGMEITEVWQLVATFENRTNCFCCTCGDREGSDVACRNHGWAAQRPCEKHEMPGQAWGEEMCVNLYLHNTLKNKNHISTCWMDKMPESVQKFTKDQESFEKAKRERTGQI